MKEEISKIEDLIGMKLEIFNLVNNYGFKFTKNDYKYQITHRIMSYGCECDTWDLLDIYRQNFYNFDTLDDLLETLNELLTRNCGEEKNESIKSL